MVDTALTYLTDVLTVTGTRETLALLLVAALGIASTTLTAPRCRCPRPQDCLPDTPTGGCDDA